jgi:hypothetical protein
MGPVTDFGTALIPEDRSASVRATGTAANGTAGRRRRARGRAGISRGLGGTGPGLCTSRPLAEGKIDGRPAATSEIRPAADRARYASDRRPLRTEMANHVEIFAAEIHHR